MSGSPKKIIVHAWKTLAPDKEFGGMTVDQFQAYIKISCDAPEQLEIGDQRTHLLKTRTYRIIRGASVIVLISLASLAGSCPPPAGGTKWIGDFSQCDKTQADATIQTIGGNIGGLHQEWGKVTPTYSGHPGCDAAYIIDYLMPPAGTNNNPGWDWAWIHVASRVPNITQDLCTQLWTSLRVYGYWTYQGAPQEQLLLESYRKATWNGNNCDFGIPDNVWMSSAYERVRAVSQHGAGYIALQPHYSYFVTNNH